MGDPMRPLLWVSKSHAKLAAALRAKGHQIAKSRPESAWQQATREHCELDTDLAISGGAPGLGPLDKRL